MHIDIYSKMDLSELKGIFLTILQFISLDAIYLILINESLLDLFALGHFCWPSFFVLISVVFYFNIEFDLNFSLYARKFIFSFPVLTSHIVFQFSFYLISLKFLYSRKKPEHPISVFFYIVYLYEMYPTLYYFILCYILFIAWQKKTNVR